MKDYKRLTNDWFDCRRCPNGECEKPDTFCKFRGRCEEYNRLKSLEDKIDSGALIDINNLMTAKTTRDLTEKEIEFFIKHNEKVRKETAREILEPLREVVMKHSDCCVNLSEDIEFLWKKYDLDLEDKE